MADNSQIIALYTELAETPDKDFGWDKGLENARAHAYKDEWIEKLPAEIWGYCAAVGNPFSGETIEEGMTVLDLGCGAGVDLLVSALHVGKSGKVIGVDITPKMVEKASYHAALAGFDNIKVLESSFDNIAVLDESVDVVISNGAINLTSCKESVFTEIYRVLKPNGKLYFADMIDISIDSESCCSVEEDSCFNSEEDWANCVAGTLRKDELIEIIQKAGFTEVSCTGLTHYTTAETTQGATFKAQKIPASTRREQHWENIFQTKDYTQVLWHQNTPNFSMDLIEKYAAKEDTIIDVGCGASYLVDKLLENGYTDITLLDASQCSLNIVKKRLKDGDVPKFIHADILEFKTEKSYKIWHDRAVFHFLLNQKEQKAYFEVLKRSLVKDGIAIISTFSTSGETQCAGLDIVQYDYEKMSDLLPQDFKIIECDQFIHVTPKDTQQQYIYFVLTL